MVDSDSDIYAFPGDGDPEAYVFDVVLRDLDNQAAKLTAALNLPLDQQERVKSVVRETGLTNHDRHIIFRQIGEKLDLTAELVVSNAFIGLWAQLCPDDIKSLLEPVRHLVPLRAPSGTAT